MMALTPDDELPKRVDALADKMLDVALAADESQPVLACAAARILLGVGQEMGWDIGMLSRLVAAGGQPTTSSETSAATGPRKADER